MSESELPLVDVSSTTQPSYAPRTRAGLLISCIGFAVLAGTPIVPALADAVDPALSLGFVMMIGVIVFVPRLIRVGPSWPRTELPRTFRTVVFFGSAVSALVAVITPSVGDVPAWSYGAIAVILAGAMGVAVIAPSRR